MRRSEWPHGMARPPPNGEPRLPLRPYLQNLACQRGKFSGPLLGGQPGLLAGPRSKLALGGSLPGRASRCQHASFTQEWGPYDVLLRRKRENACGLRRGPDSLWTLCGGHPLPGVKWWLATRAPLTQGSHHFLFPTPSPPPRLERRTLVTIATSDHHGLHYGLSQ